MIINLEREFNGNLKHFSFDLTQDPTRPVELIHYTLILDPPGTLNPEWVHTVIECAPEDTLRARAENQFNQLLDRYFARLSEREADELICRMSTGIAK